ncbi:metastasis-suppressor KiSS-1 [Paralichthys olivaceus]|uniref:metastasis-suppressor KiSS-1 n=1 Tax=Paralichthys olivaceus TaxID=8255 RepID=UPI00375214C0
MLLLIALMMVALSTEVYTSKGTVTTTKYTEDKAILKALRDLSNAAVPPSAKNPTNLPAYMIHSTDVKFLRTRWWIPKLFLQQTTKKSQDVSSYNLNSFGLRYGK